MPFGISERQPDCPSWATVKQNDDGSYTTIGCHPTKQEAVDQMVVVSLSEDMEPLGNVDRDAVEEPTEVWEPVEVRDEVNMVAPEFMAVSAARGLRLHEDGLSGDGLRPATVADARKMANGEALSEDKWRRIGPWIARHIVDLDAVQGNEVTAGLVAMLLWGGGGSKTSARRAQAYAEKLVDRLDSRTAPSSSDTVRADMTTDTTIETPFGWCVVGSDERRIAFTNLEVRAMDDDADPRLVGYAAVFDSPSEPMGFTEFVKRGAFTKTINDGADVRLLIDHEGVPLARTRSRTLTLSEDDRGLRVEASLDPLNPDAARVISAMRRGDLSQMSFAFRTIKDWWNEDRTVRELREVQLFDVSVVTYPAYEATVAELRSTQQSDTVTPTTTGLAVRKAQLAISRYR